MNRRGVLLAALTLVVPLAVNGREARTPRVGYLFSFASQQGAHLWEACRAGLRELGYVEGKNILLEPRWAESRYGRLPQLVHELLALKVDVLVTAATPASRAANSIVRTTPIVFVAVADPVRAGLVKSMARPGGNVTGLSLLTPELSGRRLELLGQSVEQLRRVAVLRNPANLSHDVFWEETRSAGERLGIRVANFDVRGPAEIATAFEMLGKQYGAQALIVFDDPMLWSQRTRIVALGEKWQLPVMYGYREFVDEGGLMSLGPDRMDHYRRTAIYVDKILRGARPGELPVEQPVKFQFVVNMRAAAAVGLTLPQSVLVGADEVLR